MAISLLQAFANVLVRYLKYFFVAIKIAGFEAEDKIARFLSTDSVEGLSLSFFVFNLRLLF